MRKQFKCSNGSKEAGNGFEKAKLMADISTSQKLAIVKRYVIGLNPEISDMKTYVLKLLKTKTARQTFSYFSAKAIDVLTGLATLHASCFPKDAGNVDEAKLYLIGVVALGLITPKPSEHGSLDVFTYVFEKYGKKIAKEYFFDVLKAAHAIVRASDGREISILNLAHPLEVEMRSDMEKWGN